MSLHYLAFFLAASLTLSYIHTVHNQLPPVNTSRYGKFGIGACPKVTPMSGFDVTKIYGEKWYLIAHYSQRHLYERHCTWSIHGDSNPGKDICRVSFERSSVKYDDGEVRVNQFFMLLPNETDPATFIDTYREYNLKTKIS